MGNVMTHIDKANGYIYGKAEDDAIRQMYSAGTGFEWDKIATVREKYVHSLCSITYILYRIYYYVYTI